MSEQLKEEAMLLAVERVAWQTVAVDRTKQLMMPHKKRQGCRWRRYAAAAPWIGAEADMQLEEELWWCCQEGMISSRAARVTQSIQSAAGSDVGKRTRARLVHQCVDAATQHATFRHCKAVLKRADSLGRGTTLRVKRGPMCVIQQCDWPNNGCTCLEAAGVHLYCDMQDANRIVRLFQGCGDLSGLEWTCCVRDKGHISLK